MNEDIIIDMIQKMYNYEVETMNEMQELSTSNVPWALFMGRAEMCRDIILKIVENRALNDSLRLVSNLEREGV